MRAQPVRPLASSIALVTGASRGVGKGVALALGEAGATVYITSRTEVAGTLVDGLGGSLEETAEEVRRLGGQCIPVACDHRDDAQVEEVFHRIDTEQEGRLDLLVNNAWAGYQQMVEQRADGSWDFTWSRPFWEQPRWRWSAMFDAGVRAAFVASQLAAARMVPRRQGLIVNISFWAAEKYLGNTLYGMAKAATNKMTADMAHELHPHGVTAVALYPGLVRTESVMRAAEHFDLSNSESPQFTGRAIARLAPDPRLAQKSGLALVVAQLAQEYNLPDIDGKRPRPLTLENV